MENTRFLKITILVLIMLNLGTLTFMWMGHRHHGGGRHMPPDERRGHHGPGGAFDFLTQQLNLDEAQVKQFEALREAHRAKARAIQEKSRAVHHRFFDLFKDPAADSALSMQLADSLAMYQKQMELLTFNHFKQVRGICKPEQQKKFDEVINEALEMMAPKPPRPPQGLDGPPPPPEN